MDCMVLYVLAPLHERLDSSKSFELTRTGQSAGASVEGIRPPKDLVW
eukprot:COSAG05_NODE_1033_length_6088_cov_21.220738_3_plen_47_part_00